MLILARSKGSLSSKVAKEFAKEMEQLGGSKYRENFDCLRMIEMLMCQRIMEQVQEYEDDTEIYQKVTKVELPLIGNIIVTPRIFHEAHGVTNKPSIHFDFTFEPSNVFKSDVLSAYTKNESPIPEYFAEKYTKQLKDLYNDLRLG